ncbi:MAG: TauD/TfdA family dioxygenase [Acidiferrobacter sp.]
MKTTVAAAGFCADRNPFRLGNDSAYRRWRAAKLAHYPQSLAALVVDIADPQALSVAERGALVQACRQTNMALYRVPAGYVPDKAATAALAAQLGLRRLAHNPLADEDGMTTLQVTPDKAARGYIPYSDKRLLWHTDGYYNAPEQSIGAFLLFCVTPAAEGGINAFLDPEMVYLQLRDADLDWVRALMAPDVMMIPANTESAAAARPARTGPVFAIDTKTGGLQMRYTARTRSIIWKTDHVTQAALAALERFMADDAPYVFRRRLGIGEGIVCNNVLHSRTAFIDSAGGGRVMYRARYYDRVAGTEPVANWY